MSAIDEFLSNNQTYANKFSKGSLPMPPAKQIAAVVCMDARLESSKSWMTQELIPRATWRHSQMLMTTYVNQ